MSSLLLLAALIYSAYFWYFFLYRAINFLKFATKVVPYAPVLDTVANTHEEHVCIQMILIHNLEIKFMC